MEAETLKAHEELGEMLAKRLMGALGRAVERVARAMYEAECHLDGNIIAWDEQTPLCKTRLRILALAAIEAIDFHPHETPEPRFARARAWAMGGYHD